MSEDPLFQPATLGAIAVKNRVVMAPLTRNRALPGQVPSDLAATYYAQRAGAGLIVSEASQIRPDGQGYLDTPGIYTREQIEGWKPVTKAVHDAGGKIVIQLWHVGRISHTSLLNGAVPVAPSAVQAKAQTYIASGFGDVSPPRALDVAEIQQIVKDYGTAAKNAIEAGFDGVEIHAANGYLIDQFLRDGANKRTDEYGGSIENRVRFLREVMDSVVGAIGAERTGIRLSPVTPANDLTDSDPQPLFDLAVAEVAKRNLAFLHMIEGATGGPRDVVPDFDFARLRSAFKGAYIANNGYTPELARQRVEIGAVDLVAFGRPFIANPDLVERIRRNAPFAEPDKATMYGGGAEGYTDYPTLDAA
jgi:N-ethylmaleimide reductase